MKGKPSARLSVVVLAAGLGTRMKSSVPKVMHAIHGKPMLHYVVEAAMGLRPGHTVVVVGKDHGAIAERLKGMKVSFAVQDRQMGTAHALVEGVRRLGGLAGTVLVMNGDAPLVRTETLKKFLSLHRRAKNSASLLSFTAKVPDHYGRVIRDRDGNPLSIVEHNDATSLERAVDEVNSGIYAFEHDALPLLEKIGLNPGKKEYYLTDVVALAVSRKRRVGVYALGDEEEFMGINTRAELSAAHAVIRARLVRKFSDAGVTFLDPASVLISPGVKIGGDTVIYPNVCIEAGTVVGRGCTVFPNVRITGSTLGDGAVVMDSSLVEGSHIGRGAQVGPFAHIRPGSRIGPLAKVGNFVEVKKSTIGKGTKAMHLSYLGDADVGSNVNIGAGTITCNYDGVDKHGTVIGDGVFVGSDTQLVAPVKVGKGAYIGAGSTITKDVPPGSLSLSRPPQKTIEGWAARKRKKP